MPCVLIDDLESAMALWSNRWRGILGERLLAQAESLRQILAEQGWWILSYEQFPKWLRDQAAFPRVSLDNLLPPHRVVAPTIALHRGDNGRGGLETMLGAMVGVETLRGATVTLVDDACYTGGTLVAAVEALKRLNINVAQAQVLISKLSILKVCPSAPPLTIRTLHVAPPGWDIIHFRDFFHLLPFSGRSPNPPTPGNHRLLGICHRAGAMLGLQESPDLRRVVLRANLALLDALLAADGEEAIGREVAESEGRLAFPLGDTFGAPNFTNLSVIFRQMASKF